MVLDYFYDSMASTDLCCRLEATLTCGERPMDATRETFQNWPYNCFENVVDKDSVDHGVLIVSATCCALRYMNNSRYLERDEDPGLKHVRNVCKIM